MSHTTKRSLKDTSITNRSKKQKVKQEHKFTEGIPPLSKYKLKKAKQEEAERLARQNGEYSKNSRLNNMLRRNSIKSFSLFDEDDSPLANINNFKEIPSNHDNPYDLRSDLKFQRQLRLIQLGNAHLSQMAHPTFISDDIDGDFSVGSDKDEYALGESQNLMSNKNFYECDQDSDGGNISSSSQSSSNLDFMNLDLDLDLDLEFNSNMNYLDADSNLNSLPSSSSYPDTDRFNMSIPISSTHKFVDESPYFDSILGSLNHLPGTESLKSKIPKINTTSRSGQNVNVVEENNDTQNKLISPSSGFNILNFKDSISRSPNTNTLKNQQNVKNETFEKDQAPLMLSEFLNIDQSASQNLPQSSTAVNTFSPKSKNSFEYRHNNRTLNLALTKEPQRTQQSCKQALKRLAIWSGKAQEMVYDGSLPFEEFII